jgi:hypothetical protein
MQSERKYFSDEGSKLDSNRRSRNLPNNIKFRLIFFTSKLLTEDSFVAEGAVSNPAGQDACSESESDL